LTLYQPCRFVFKLVEKKSGEGKKEQGLANPVYQDSVRICRHGDLKKGGSDQIGNLAVFTGAWMEGTAQTRRESAKAVLAF